MFINGESKMFKQIVTLFRGQAFEAQEAVVDGYALTILRQQIRDCAGAVTATRRAMAIAIAQNEQEIVQCVKIKARIADLETRTLQALELNKQELAHEAAETIAILEMERDSSLAAQSNFSREISRLKGILRASETRLKDIERGQRIAAVTERTQHLREQGAGSTQNALRDAEATLSRLQIRQRQIDVTQEVMAEMDKSSDPSALSEKLAAAGCGAPLKTGADDVLKRLQLQMKSQA
jgi:phage shock protein A